MLVPRGNVEYGTCTRCIKPSVVVSQGISPNSVTGTDSLVAITREEIKLYTGKM